jgi:hypothetical protein
MTQLVARTADDLVAAVASMIVEGLITMARIVVRWADNGVATFAGKIDALHRQLPNVLPRIVNQVGGRAKTQVTRSLTKQTGLPRKTIVKAIGRPRRAHAGRLTYEMQTAGGNIRLKYLKPRETRPGATAAPWNRRQLFAGTFILGGAFPNRHGLVRKGHVMRRLDSRGRKLTFARSGMFIPTEMITGATAAAFTRIAAPLLKQRVEAAVGKLVS